MTVTYQVEQFAAIDEEVRPLWHKHWLTSAVDHTNTPLAPNTDSYKALEAAGILRIVTARKDGMLIGYFFTITTPASLHYSQPESYCDIYYIDCDDAPMARLSRYRDLFRFMLADLRSIGIKKALTGTKVHSDLGPIWRSLGWKDHETIFYMRLT